VGRLYQWEVGCAYGYYFYASATQHVNGYQSLYILEAVSHEYINFCHNLFVVSWKNITFAVAKIAKVFQLRNNSQKK